MKATAEELESFVPYLEQDDDGQWWKYRAVPSRGTIQRSRCAERVCLRCEKMFISRADSKGMFCSVKCIQPPHLMKSGSEHVAWKGGRVINSSGYVLLYTNPSALRPHERYQYEHRLVMEKHLGRSLVKGESVHHVNGDRTDNRLENLQLRLRHGVGQAYCCSDCGSKRISPVPLDGE